MPGPNLNLRTTPQPTVVQPRAPAFAGLKPDADLRGSTVKGPTAAAAPPGKPIGQRMADVGRFLASGASSVWRGITSRTAMVGDSAMARIKGVSVDQYKADRARDAADSAHSSRLDRQMQADWDAGVDGNGDTLAAHAELDLAAHAKTMSKIDRQFGDGMGMRTLNKFQGLLDDAAKIRDAGSALLVQGEDAMGARAGSAEGRAFLEPRLQASAKKLVAADASELAKARVEHAKFHDIAVATVPGVATARADALFEKVNLHGAGRNAAVVIGGDLNAGGPDSTETVKTVATTRQVFEFVARNLDACSNEAFYSVETSRGNATMLGMAASLAVIDRMAAGGEATAKDLADLQRCLGPYERPRESMTFGGEAPTPRVPPTLLGPLDSDKLAAMADLVMARYGGEFNTDQSTGAEALERIAGSTTGQEKIENVRQGFFDSSKGNGMGADTIQKGLNAVEKWATAEAPATPAAARVNV